MNKNLLKSVIMAYGDTQTSLAAALGLSLSSLNAKINGKRAEFRQSEIDAIKARYSLSAEEVTAIFFCI